MPVTQTQPVAQPVFQTIAPVDTASLKKQYGDDALVDKIAAPVNAAIAAINAIVPTIQAGQQAAAQAAQTSLANQVEEFFSGKEIQTFSPLYGKSRDQMTGDQIQNRNKVLETADALMTGALVQGRRMPVSEALLSAHDMVSGTFKAAAARADLKSAVQKRAAGVQLRPTAKGGSKTGADPKGVPESREQLVDRTRQRLAQAFTK